MTITWYDPAHPDVPVFRYSSSKDLQSAGLLVEIEYHPDGTLRLVHVEIGNVNARASDVAEAITAGVVSGVVEAITGMP